MLRPGISLQRREHLKPDRASDFITDLGTAVDRARRGRQDRSIVYKHAGDQQAVGGGLEQTGNYQDLAGRNQPGCVHIRHWSWTIALHKQLRRKAKDPLRLSQPDNRKPRVHLSDWDPIRLHRSERRVKWVAQGLDRI